MGRLSGDPATWSEAVAQGAYILADLYAALGRSRESITQYARLDSVTWRGSAQPLIRGWAERAALHQALGENDEAIRLYEQVVEALSEADETMDGFVARVSAALAAARGETGAATRR